MVFLFGIKMSDSTELYLVTLYSPTHTLYLAIEGQNNIESWCHKILQYISSLERRIAVNSNEVLIKKIFPLYKVHKIRKDCIFVLLLGKWFIRIDLQAQTKVCSRMEYFNPRSRYYSLWLNNLSAFNTLLEIKIKKSVWNMLRTTCISLINSIFSMPYLSFLLAYLLQTLNQSKAVFFLLPILTGSLIINY